MPDEQVASGSAGQAERSPRRRSGIVAAADAAPVIPNLDERQRNIRTERRAMGPPPPVAGPGPAAEAALALTPAPDVPATDPVA